MLRNRFSERLKDALRSKDQRTISTVRLILAALKDRDIAARGRGKTDGIGEDEILQMLQTMVKQRRDAIEMYKMGQRDDLVRQEEEEIVIIESFLPKQLGEAEMDAAVAAVVAELGATGIKDMGRVMGALKERFAGQMDFAKASAVAKRRLA
ncbi:MAG: GatB/YqeY domain-containing protein [Alphaproteobacteria bacterium]|nr:GatB/YqeY domain-containing protein [Alphaproteobacteria bacterium]